MNQLTFNTTTTNTHLFSQVCDKSGNIFILRVYCTYLLTYLLNTNNNHNRIFKAP